MDVPSPIQEIIMRYRAQLANNEQAAIGQLQAGYQRVYTQLQAEQDALLQQVEAMRARGEPITSAQIRKLQRYRDLIAHTCTEIADYARIIQEQVTRDGPGAVYMGLDMGAELMRAMLPPELYATFQRPPDEAVQAMIAALQENSPLWSQTLAPMGDETARGVGDALLRNLLAGKNPLTVAREMTNVWGVPLTRAMTIARTEMLRAHRMATLEQYRVNSNVVTGWQWYANLDTRTCLSCVAKHGEEFPLSETMDDHCNGRCVMMPITPSWAELGFEGMPEGFELEPDDGEDWFNGLDEAAQRAMMGPGKYELWRGGGFEFSALSRPVYDEDWGRMFVEATLGELAGGDE